MDSLETRNTIENTTWHAFSKVPQLDITQN